MSKKSNLNESNIKLKEIDGIRFRVMWSTRILYLLLCLLITMIFFVAFTNYIEYDSTFFKYYKIPHLIFSKIHIVLLILLVILLNDKYLSPIVAVINEKGIYTRYNIILWEDIDEICYKIKVPFLKSSNKYSLYCHLEITTSDYTYKILHVPHKIVRYIKRYVPNVKVKKDKEFIVLYLLCIIGLIIFSFVLKFKKQ